MWALAMNCLPCEQVFLPGFRSSQPGTDVPYAKPTAKKHVTDKGFRKYLAEERGLPHGPAFVLPPSYFHAGVPHCPGMGGQLVCRCQARRGEANATEERSADAWQLQPKFQRCLEAKNQERYARRFLVSG